MEPLRHDRRFLEFNSVLFFILVIGFLGRATRACPCKNYRSSTPKLRSDDVYSGQSRPFACCPFGVLGFDDPNAKIQWAHNGTHIDESNGRHRLQCGKQQLLITNSQMSDSGIYTCNVTSSNGTVGSVGIRLKVFESSGYHEGPKDVQVTDKCSWKGDAANITCQAMVGKIGPGVQKPSLSWWYITSSGTPKNIADDIIKNISKVDDQGILRSTLVFKSVRSEHYGTYMCQLSNSYKTTHKKVNFTEGDPHDCKTVDFPKIFVVLIATVSCLILALLYLWWRFRIVLKIMYKRRKHKVYARDGFLHDVFIVHGDRVSFWISDFVYTLESTYGYSCYVPGRDMLGGEQIADAICNEMKKSRRVLVVITPCLLQSQWALWSAENGIHTCLKDSTIFGVVLQEYGNDVSDLETNVRLKTLNPIMRLKVPKVLRLKEDQAVKEEEDLNKNPSKVGIIGHSAVSSLSQAPKSQYLSNMITGSNNASRESLNKGTDYQEEGQKKDVAPPGTYFEYAGMEEEPGSPCSVTPFILPSSKASCNMLQESKRHTRFQFFTRLRSVLVGDPKTVFWQKVRLYLDPPTMRRKITVESTA